jgi:hypothetical protein
MSANDEPVFSAAVPNDPVLAAYQLVGQHLTLRRLGQPSLLDSFGISDALYQPDDDLKQQIAAYNRWVEAHKKTKSTRRSKRYYEEAGELMEQVALLTFRCLLELENIESYRSHDGQLDIVVTLHRSSLLSKILQIAGYRIIVEAKNINDPIDVKTFSRLCTILTYKFKKQGFLGIFFTRASASGFPKPGDARQIALKDARAIQAVYHAASDKYVVVFDHDDLQRLVEAGGLVRLLIEKIDEVEGGTGLTPSKRSMVARRIDLPSHLAQFWPKK